MMMMMMMMMMIMDRIDLRRSPLMDSWFIAIQRKLNSCRLTNQNTTQTVSKRDISLEVSSLFTSTADTMSNHSGCLTA